MHGPQALARTIPPISLSDLSMASLSMVALICSEPGVIVKVDLDRVVKNKWNMSTWTP